MSDTDPVGTPDELMTPLREGPSMMRLMTKSLVIHLVVILVSSLPYLVKCARYGTFDVRTATALERRALEEEQRRERKAERETRRSEAAKKAPARVEARKPDRPEPRIEDAEDVEPAANPEDSDLNVDEEFGL